MTLCSEMPEVLVALSVYSAGAPTLRAVGPNHSRQTAGSWRATSVPVDFTSSAGGGAGVGMKTVGLTSPVEVFLASARLTPSASGLTAGLRIGGTGSMNGSSAWACLDFSGRLSPLAGRSGIVGSGRTIGRSAGRVCAEPSVAQPATPTPRTKTPATQWNGRMFPSPDTDPSWDDWGAFTVMAGGTSRGVVLLSG